MVTTFQFILGYILDLLLGDPGAIPHPIIGIGNLISSSEKTLRKNERFLKFKGCILFIWILSVSWFSVFIIIRIASNINIYFKDLVSAFIIFQILATKSLYKETFKVYKALQNGDSQEAKRWLSYLVTRDCEDMNEAEIIKSTIETISENIVDGITAPMFYIALGGAPLGMLYKAVNTLDSMVGYKNEKYKDFGFVAARMDDFFNYLPARLTSIFIVISSGILGKNMRKSFKILVRDRKNHNSPNSGWAEAPVAGALGLQLGGKVSYFGTEYNKPTMGDDINNPSIDHILDSHKIMFITSGLMFFLFLIIIKLGEILW